MTGDIPSAIARDSEITSGALQPGDVTGGTGISVVTATDGITINATGGGGTADGVVQTATMSVSAQDLSLTLDRSIGADVTASVTLPALQLLDENILVHPQTWNLDFMGQGVTCATGFANTVTCTIPGGGDSFSIHDLPVQTQLLATGDRIPFSDESGSGDPNEYLTAFNFFSSIRDVIGTNRGTPLDNDRMYVTREDTAGDPLGYITIAQLETRLSGGGTTLDIAGLPQESSSNLADRRHHGDREHL